MKIVSKFKDFYDYLVQDHDADLIYVRNIGLVNEYLDDLIRQDNIAIPSYSPYYGYIDSCLKNRKNGELEFDNFIFGIYPFVYSQPILKVCYRYLVNGSIQYFFIILGNEIVNKILDSDENINRLAIKELKHNAQTLFDKEVGKMYEHANVDFASYKKLSDIKKSLQYHTWKIECANIFYKMQSPVFVKFDHLLFDNGAYADNWPKEPKIGNQKYTHYVTDISFRKLNFNIIKYWYNDVYDLNTYINIENFLWSIKQEPESTPDNNTKILAHGFDLKTSFRKM